MSEIQTEWLTTSQAAERLGVTAATVANWAKDGQLTGYRIGAHLRFKPDDIQAFIKPAAELEAAAK